MRKGRYGPYVKHGRTNATLPKDFEVDDVTLEQAVELIAAKVAKGDKKKAKKKTVGKSTKKTKPATAETDTALTDA